MNRTSLTCNQCGKVFTMMPSDARSKLKRNGGKVFCNVKCSSLAKRVAPIELTCDYCGKKFMVPRDEAMKRKKQKHVFCKYKCYSDFYIGKTRGK